MKKYIRMQLYRKNVRNELTQNESKVIDYLCRNETDLKLETVLTQIFLKNPIKIPSYTYSIVFNGLILASMLISFRSLFVVSFAIQLIVLFVFGFSNIYLKETFAGTPDFNVSLSENSKFHVFAPHNLALITNVCDKRRLSFNGILFTMFVITSISYYLSGSKILFIIPLVNFALIILASHRLKVFVKESFLFLKYNIDEFYNYTTGDNNEKETL